MSQSNVFARAEKTRSFLAENSGVIVLNTQRDIEGMSNPSYALQRIKEEVFDTKDGEGTREIVSYITQPTRTQYAAILGEGNETASSPNPATGDSASISGDKPGRGCSIPADTMSFGYDVRTSCLKARAVEIGPFCIIDLIRKNAHREIIQRLWDETPGILRAQFARQLQREVVRLGKFKFTAASGVPMSTDVAYFAAPPKGGPDIGMMRRIANQVMPYGWADGSMTPKMDGMPTFQLFMGHDAYEWAIERRKLNKGFKVETTRTADDKVFGATAIYEGLNFIADMRPQRGYLIQTGAAAWEFVEIEPTAVVPADGEGWKEIPNDEYEADYVFRGGASYRVIELAHYIHPKALVRESMGGIPSVPGKTFTRRFDFTVNPMTDVQLGNKGCDPDMFFFGYRALHAYAMKRRKYELAGSFLFLSAKPRYDVTDPWTNPDPAAAAEPTNVADLPFTPVNDCEPCTRPGFPAREAIMPTCDELFPANGAGNIAFRQIAYDVEEAAGNLTLVIDRYGGNTGAASVVCTLTEGTATNPENFTTPSGFAGSGPWTKTISWADGEDGPKTVIVPIVEAVGDDSGKIFTAAVGTPSGASLGTRTTATVTILDEDEA